jgi:NADPH:quinone reductase-like Zn-dependent oxidoreductase
MRRVRGEPSQPEARPGEIVVRARAVNPFDRLQQTMGDIFTPWTPYPFMFGSDVPKANCRA